MTTVGARGENFHRWGQRLFRKPSDHSDAERANLGLRRIGAGGWFSAARLLMRAIPIALIAFCIFSVPAGAQVYDFTYSCGPGCGITNGVITLGQNMQATSFSGDGTGLSSVALDGSFSLSSSVSSQSNFNSSSYYILNFSTSNPNTGNYSIQLLSSSLGTSNIGYFPSGGGEIDSTGTSTASLSPAPGPIPGSGLISYVLLAITGVRLRAKSLARQAGMAFRSLRSVVRTKLLAALTTANGQPA